MKHFFPKFKTLICAVSFTVLATAAIASTSHAEFLLTTASGVYQDTSGLVKVVVSSKAGAEGLFIMAGPNIPPQEFNLETTPKADSRHIFVRFDDQATPLSYTEVIIDSKSYKVSGNLTIKLGGVVAVSIDNNNPYLSVVTEGAASKGKPAILGFSGLTEVVRSTGPAAAILAANQLDKSIADIIKPYIVENGSLTLSGKATQTPTIGTYVKPDSDCLSPDAVVLTSAQLQQIQSSKSEEQRVIQLEQAIKASQKKSPIAGHLTLKAEQSSVILLDIRQKNVKELHPVIGTNSKRKVCVLSEIKVG